MKKYLMIFSVLAFTFTACTNSKTKEEEALEAAKTEAMIHQRIIDSMAIVNLEANQQINSAPQSINAGSKSQQTSSKTEQAAAKKGMSNRTKGALIGTGAGIVAGAVTGAAASDDKVKGAVIGGAVGGAVGSGVGYGIGADKDKKEGNKKKK